MVFTMTYKILLRSRSPFAEVCTGSFAGLAKWSSKSLPSQTSDCALLG